MKLIFALAMRNALRNRRRSMLTAMTVLLGTALLTIGLAWVTGVFSSFIKAGTQSIGEVRVASQAYIDREQLAPLYLNLPRTDKLVEGLSKVSGVRAVYPRIQMGVLASKGGEELGETFGLLVGAPESYFTSEMGLRERISEGHYFSADRDASANEALIGVTLAGQMGVHAGEEAIFVGQTQDGSMAPIRVQIAGLVDTGTGVFDKQIYVPLDKARWMADIPDGALELLIFGGNIATAQRLADNINLALPALTADSGAESLVAQAWLAREPWAGLLVVARAMLGIIGGIIVFISALGVLNTMLMSVLERVAEIGVLRALGLGRLGTMALFIIEAMTIAAVGGAVGVLLGSLGAIWLQNHGIDLGSVASKMPPTLPANRVLRAEWTPMLAVAAMLLGQLMALLGAAVPAWHAIRIQPVQAMRARR